jgi:hypothetical protein
VQLATTPKFPCVSVVSSVISYYLLADVCPSEDNHAGIPDLGSAVIHTVLTLGERRDTNNDLGL